MDSNKPDPRGLFEQLDTQMKELEHLGGILQVMDNNPEQLTELLETGTVEMHFVLDYSEPSKSKRFLFTLHVEELK